MKHFRKKKEQKRRSTKTYPIQFSFEETQENIRLNLNTFQKQSKNEILSKAFDSHSKGHILEAEKYYRYLIKKGFNDPGIYSNYGVILKRRGDTDKAIKLYQKCIEIFPNSSEAYNNLGNIYKDLGKIKESEKYHRKAIDIDSEFAEANNNLGNTLKTLGKLEEAEKYFLKAIKINPNYIAAYNNLGSTLIALGKLSEAELFTRKAIKLNTNLAEAHINLGNIMIALNRLHEAELSICRAIDIDPKNKKFKSNLLALLTIYDPKETERNKLYKINIDYKEINLNIDQKRYICNNQVKKLYLKGLSLYNENQLDLETHLTQIYKSKELELNCKRHMYIFNKHKVIPKFCFNCFKVQVELDSVIDLIKLYLVFNSLKLKNNNTRKCFIEMRPNISGFYKGLIYCEDLEEANQISNQLNLEIQKNISIDLKSKVKHGCSEYSLEYPAFKEINKDENKVMSYNKNWRILEEEFDRENRFWSKEKTSIKGFNLNNFLIIRNWIGYAQIIEDKTVETITDEKISLPKRFFSIKRKKTYKNK